MVTIETKRESVRWYVTNKPKSEPVLVDDSLGGKVSERMKELGLTNKRLSEISGIAEPNVSKIVTSTIENPHMPTLVKLFKALQLTSWDQLLPLPLEEGTE